MTVAMIEPESTAVPVAEEPPVEDVRGAEFVDGRWVEKHVGAKANLAAGRLYRGLAALCEERRLGWVFMLEVGYRCFPSRPRQIRKPDVSFVRLDRFPDGEVPEGFLTVAPDLAVEVVSPGDLYEEVLRRANDFLAAGTRLVWVLNPDDGSAMEHRPDGAVVRIPANGRLSGGDVLPGFECALADLFRPLVPPTPPAPTA
jgi:Uma2 family endonuclease